MRQFNYNVQDAMQWVCNRHYKIQAEFMALLETLPSFNPQVDKDLKEYLNNLGRVVRGNVEWSFQCRRYFGNHGLEVQRTRLVPLKPKVKVDADGLGPVLEA